MFRWLLIGLVACSGKARIGPHPRTPKELTCSGEIQASSATRLLTRIEYDHALADLLGDTTQPARSFPREPLLYGFDNNADIYRATPDSVQQYLMAAEFAAARAVKNRKALLVSCASEDAACGDAFVRAFGRRMFRRPLTAAEVTALVGYFETTLAQEGSFDTALEWTLQVMLQAPQFLYKIEPGTLQPQARKLSGFELATRLSFLLWASAPDEALLDAAQAGALDTPSGVAQQVDRLLADPRHVRALDHFFSQWLRLDGLDSLSKDPATYTSYPGRHALASWRQSLMHYLHDVMANDGTLRGILTTPSVFVDKVLADMYGMAPPPGGSEFHRIDTDPDERVGLLGQPAWLALLASPDQSSPVRRGVFIMRNLVCRAIGNPPADVAIIPPSLDSGATTRERFTQHSQSSSCHTCHKSIDPLGFGLEHFDGIGAYRERDGDKPVDARGEFIDFRESTLNGPFEGNAELALRLANSPAVHDCFVTQFFRYAMGRVETELDACAVETLQQRFYDSGGNIHALVRAVTESDPFLRRAPVVSE